MKRILYYIIIASALFLIKTAFALDATPNLSFTTTQQVANVHYYPSNCNSLFFDAILADITDDDDSKESERKKPSFGNSSAYDTSFGTQNFSENNLNSILLAHFLYPRRTPLFIFICEFRI